MSKICSSCGYKTEEKDLKCPICGGALYRGGGAADPCDPAEEAQWNGGYHNDFEEGRKTGKNGQTKNNLITRQKSSPQVSVTCGL